MTERKVKLRIRAVPQTDGCGCGFFALSAMYRYYGLSPSAMNLRARLGTDHFMPYGLPEGFRTGVVKRWPGLKGTWPMDIFAVLYGDGFQTRKAPSDYSAFRRAVRQHLSKGHPALALVDGFGHWVVISGIEEGGLWIADSMIDEDEDPAAQFVEDEEYKQRRNADLFVSRRKQAKVRDMTKAAFLREYIRGTQFVAPCVGKAVVTALRRCFGQ